MSIEKLSDLSKVSIEQIPYTQISNNVIQHIKDNDAFRLYCYLISKSRDWKVVKEYAAKQCAIGEKKARECWSYFARCGLIEYQVVKDEKGKIIQHDMIVLIGLKFNKDEPFKSTQAEIASLDEVHRGKNPLSGQSTRVDFAPLLNKDITKQRKNITKEILRNGENAQNNDSYFEQFWNRYPKKKDKTKTKKIWDKKKYPPETVKIILDDIEKRKQDDVEWQDKQFIPYPSTYLNGERWNDEITKVSQKCHKSVMQQSPDKQIQPQGMQNREIDMSYLNVVPATREVIDECMGQIRKKLNGVQSYGRRLEKENDTSSEQSA